MELIIGHYTAFMYWRSFTGKRFLLKDSPRTLAMTERVDLNNDLLRELAALGIRVSERLPLHLLFSSQELRSRSPLIRAHLMSGNVPPGSFIRLSEHVLIASPELCFAEMSGTLSLEKLILAGYELCGTYAQVPRPDQPSRTALADRAPLTTAQTIKTFLTFDSFTRYATAHRAKEHIQDNAASPMEAKVAMLLSLPTRLGGYGLPRPMLNEIITLEGEARLAYPRSTCRPDLWWPMFNVAIEYDGRDSHEGEWAHAKDIARIAALKLTGMDVTVLTFAQVADDPVFDALAVVLARKLQHRLRFRFSEEQGESGHVSRRSKLRRELEL